MRANRTTSCARRSANSPSRSLQASYACRLEKRSTSMKSWRRIASWSRTKPEGKSSCSRSSAQGIQHRLQSGQGYQFADFRMAAMDAKIEAKKIAFDQVG